MKTIRYTLTIDENKHKVSFSDTRAATASISVYDDSPEAMATLYRAAAAHFIEMAFMQEHRQNFTLPDYGAAEQARKMIAENQTGVLSEAFAGK